MFVFVEKVKKIGSKFAYLLKSWYICMLVTLEIVINQALSNP